MDSFWCDNILIKGDLKNTKSCQNIQGHQVVKSTLFYLEKLNQINSYFTTSDIFSVVVGLVIFG